MVAWLANGRGGGNTGDADDTGLRLSMVSCRSQQHRHRTGSGRLEDVDRKEAALVMVRVEQRKLLMGGPADSGYVRRSIGNQSTSQSARRRPAPREPGAMPHVPRRADAWVAVRRYCVVCGAGSVGSMCDGRTTDCLDQRLRSAAPSRREFARVVVDWLSRRMLA